MTYAKADAGAKLCRGFSIINSTGLVHACSHQQHQQFVEMHRKALEQRQTPLMLLTCSVTAGKSEEMVHTGCVTHRDSVTGDSATGGRPWGLDHMGCIVLKSMPYEVGQGAE